MAEIVITEAGLEYWLQGVWDHYTRRGDDPGLMLQLTAQQQLVEACGHGQHNWAWQMLEDLIRLVALRFAAQIDRARRYRARSSRSEWRIHPINPTTLQ